MSQNEESLLVSSHNGILKIIFNRPKKKNAITLQMYKDLADVINNSTTNNNIRMLVLTGRGDFFSSGNDFIDSMSGSPEESNGLYKKFVDALIKCPKLLVAIVNGPAIGIAATILALFDIVYAFEMAYLSTPFSKLGLVAEGCSTYTFPRLMGKSKAGEMLYFSHKMPAEEAKEYGLVSKIYKPDSLDDIWKFLDTMVTTMSFESIGAIKMLVNRWNQDILLKVNEEEATELKKRYTSEDLLNRISSAFHKRSKL